MGSINGVSGAVVMCGDLLLAVGGDSGAEKATEICSGRDSRCSSGQPQILSSHDSSTLVERAIDTIA